MNLSVRRWLVPLAALGVVSGCSQNGDSPLSPRLTPGGPSRGLGAASPVVISQVYGGGGNQGATLKNDFIELYNPGPTDVVVNGWSVQYASAAGTSWQVTPLTGTIPAGHYYLVQEAAGAGGVPFSLTADVTTGTIPMSATAGKVALVSSTTALTGSCPTSVIDFVGFGGTASCFEGTGATPAPSNSNAVLRNANATDTNDNAADFTAGAPNPRNTSVAGSGSGGPQATVASIAVTPSNPTIFVGGTQTMTATASDANGQPIAGVTFTWASSNTAIATVDAAGKVTGVAAGTATISAKAPNDVTGSTTVTVTNAPPPVASNVRVSEFHYDNTGTDVGEQVELEGDVGGTVTGWKLYLYSGSPGSATIGQFYDTITLTGAFAACTAGGTRGVLVFDTPGLQNGDADGFALVNAAGEVVEFLSYEGAFQATNGPAAGMTSTDVGVSEANAPAVGRSLQRAANGTWYGPFPSTFGQCNPATPPAPQTGISFSGRLSSDPALPIGFQDQVFATQRDANTGATVPTTFTWTSETPSIMTVDDRGVVTAIALGTGIIRATAADGTTSTLSLPTETPVFGNASLYKNPLAFGVPTDATPADEFRVTRDQYVLSYNKTTHTPNWVAEHLTKANRGDLPGYRCDCFAVDPRVVDGSDPGISTADYTGSGFDRGHMVRSNDRELAHGDQATTYYTTNIVPQWANLNQGRWADLESYLQTVEEGPGNPEVYIFAGPRGNAGTIANGRIVVPVATWKVAVVLPAGMSPASITKASDIIDIIAVDMPNVSNLPRDGNWQAHRVTVDSVEKATGYDLLSALPNSIEEVVESGDRAPTARISGAGAAGGEEGQTLAFGAATSSDPDVGGTLDDALSYAWSVDGANVGIGASLSHAFTDDGTYQVRLIVADKFGAADTAVTSVTVSNVGPTVAALPNATILRGESYQTAGSFTDPGADTWTATVNYGAGAAPLALSGKTFQLSHAYTAAGSFTVTVTVRDDDAGEGARTAQVTVLSAGDGVQVLTDMIGAFQTAGKLASTEVQPLSATLAAASRSLAADRPSSVNQIGAFINQVEALQQSGRLSAADAATLISYARRILASIG
jgi:DNA/RNA endonuclease G (NUC1)